MVWSEGNNDVFVLIFGTGVLLILVVGMISFFLIYQRRLLREQNRVQALEIDLQRRVMAAIIDTQEIERKRLAEDMHDELGALILALKLGNHQLLKKNQEDSLREDRVRKNEEMIESIANRVREISHNLLPPALKRGHFENALQLLCDMLNENTGLRFDLEKNTEDVDIVQKDQISLYRVLNEWFTNVVKYSNASKVEVSLHMQGKNFILDVKDDGKGFDFERALEQEKGLGLMSMDGRLKQMNASYSFQPNVPKGTHFHIQYPMQQ